MTKDDEEEEEEEEEEVVEVDNDKSKRQKTRQGPKEVRADHCSINFVKDTRYSLLAGSTQRCWGTATADDPAPPVPASRRDSVKTGDYLLILGKNIKLKPGPTTFLPEEELILTSEWHQFEEEMTGQDLADLDDVPFLLWWQNVKAPPVPKPKAPTVAKAKTKGKGRSRR
jgi:hypothetical protein